MMRKGTYSLLALVLLCAGGQPIVGAEAKAEDTAAPEFKDVYDLLRTHLAGMSEAQLNQAAVRALVTGLGPRVSLLTNGPTAQPQPEVPVVGKSSVFDSQIAYVRVERVGDSLANALREAWKALGSTNKLTGLILDLRYTSGDDYASAAAAAELFLKKDVPLLNWGNGMVRSPENRDAISVPVAVLVNHETARAAEALAAVLRESGAGLVLGTTTAGQAMVAQEFPLKNGDRLRIGTGPIQLGDGASLSSRGLKPDILVEVSPADERAFYADAYKVLSRAEPLAEAGMALTNSVSGTNRAARRPRMNEAELVRERREGISEADVTALREREPEKPVVSDPVLARALDLLKGLAVVRQSHS